MRRMLLFVIFLQKQSPLSLSPLRGIKWRTRQQRVVSPAARGKKYASVSTEKKRERREKEALSTRAV